MAAKCRWIIFFGFIFFSSSPELLAADGGFELKICDSSAKTPKLLDDLQVLNKSAPGELGKKQIDRFKAILSSEGWPTAPCTGVAGIDIAARLLFRSSADHDFQLAVLRGLDPQVGVDVDPYDFANLWDAVSLKHDGTQTYGTIAAAGVDGHVRPVGKMKNDDARLFFRDFYGLASFSPDSLTKADVVDGYEHSGWNGHLGRPQPTYSQPKLRDQLGEMISEDQQARVEAIRAKGEERKKLMKKVSSVDAKNLVELKKVFLRFGFPNVKMVGRDGVSTVFLLVQHADADPAFQRHALELAKPLMKSRQLSKQQYAYLTDRVRLADGKKQLYGTQVSTKGNKAEPLPVEGPEHLDSRRASMNLGAEKDYLKAIEAQYADH